MEFELDLTQNIDLKLLSRLTKKPPQDFGARMVRIRTEGGEFRYKVYLHISHQQLKRYPDDESYDPPNNCKVSQCHGFYLDFKHSSNPETDTKEIEHQPL